MAQKVFYSRHSGGITIYMDGKPLTVSSTHANFQKILEALKDGAYDLVTKLMDVVGTINRLGISKKFADRKVYVEKGQVFYIDSHKISRKLSGPLVERILDDLAKPSAEKYADALLAFCDNVMKNKIKDIREELWEFLASGKTPITMDGCFLAYKKVRAPNSDGQYLDIYSGEIDNSPGSIPRMKQDDVDPDRHRECSRGLHFCSRGYLSSYSGHNGNRVVVVKVNPRHVFAIPTDYQFQKGRASEYYVVGEVNSNWAYNTDIFKDSFIDEDTKVQAAPEVTFKVPLKASLETLAKSYGLLDQSGRVQIIKLEDELVPVRLVNVMAQSNDGTASKSSAVDIIGTPVAGDVKYMSLETKSVRTAVKAAIQKAQGSSSS
jgi:hypothetical protein